MSSSSVFSHLVPPAASRPTTDSLADVADKLGGADKGSPTSTRSYVRSQTAFPADWPARGPIDLGIHDLPHTSSTLEWWYVNAHVETETGRELALFAAFFRELKGHHPETGAPEYAHSIAWAISDAARKRFYPTCAVDSGAPGLGLRKLDAGGGVGDERLNRAMREVLERGRVPGPTQLFEREAIVFGDRLDLDYAGNHFRKGADGAYELCLGASRGDAGCRLVFRPLVSPVRHGNDGVLHGVADELMFYYFIPRCEVTGSLTLEGEALSIAKGAGWYDHEFGFVPETVSASPPSAAKKNRMTAWSWASIQLDNDTNVTVYSIARISTGESLDKWAIITDRHGNRRQFDRVWFRPVESWTSTRSFVEYPTSWELAIPDAKLQLRVDATFADQEVLTVISDPGFWEGQVNVHGYEETTKVTGRGWVERKGFRFEHLDDFFKAASKEVQRQVAKVLPLEPTTDDLSHLVTRRGNHGHTAGVDPEQLGRVLVGPIREIIDRGGKAWRSYAGLACVDVVGGDSRKFVHWLAMPELLHVGSLIVDDVEDGSELRRGGPTAHVVHGEPLAINAGTAAYFLCEPRMDGLPAETRVRIYESYFDAMRAGHAGQALDIDGVAALVPAAVTTGDVDELERRVLAIHRLKTAVPAGMTARIGAILGGGTDLQVEGIGNFFEAIGLAFQIIDDVLNLRGFEGNLKAKGEDIQQGKVTLPVVKGLGLLPIDGRRWLWKELSSKTRDPETIATIIVKLESVGAIEACARQARQLVEDAWKRLDPLIEDSQHKVIFRAFGWYVLERHY